MTRVLWTTASAVALAWGCGAAAASDIQLSDRIFLETEGFFAPSYTTGGDQEGLFALGELQGKGYYIIKPGYLLGGQVRAETVMLDDDLDAQTEIEQAFAFYATPLGDVSVGKFAGMTGALVYGAPSAIGRGYGVNFPEFVPVDNPFLAPFSSSSSPTFFDTDPRIALNTPIYNDYIIGISYAPEVETIGTNEIEDVVEIAGLKRFALGGVDLGLSAGVLTGNTNSGSTFGREFFNDNVWATNFGFDLVYGNLNVGGSAVYYENLDGFDDISLTAYTLGATYQFGPLTAGLAYGLATTDLPETGDSANLSFGDAQTEQIEASLNYALVPGIDIGLAVVHMDRSDDRFGTDLENEETYGVLQTTFSFGEDNLAVLPAFPYLFVPGKYQGYAEGEFKTGDDRSIGGGSLFFPLYQTDNLLTFTDLRFTNADDDSGEYNLGLGIRRLYNPGFILGGYAYFDQRTTPNDNTFYQGMAGVELLTKNFDLRFNGYLPEGGSSPLQGVPGDVVLSGGQLGIRGQEEVALAGFDGEIGMKLPLPFQKVSALAYLGGYHFDRDGAEEISGPRGRVEVRFNDLPLLGEGSRATVGVEAQSDDPRGDQFFALARLRVPFSFLTGGSSTSGLEGLETRMTERVVRDVDVVVGTRDGGVEAVTVAATGAEIDEVRYANAVGGGTGLDPTSPTDLATAIASAGVGGLIIVDGGAGDIINSSFTSLLADQSVLGGGQVLALVGSDSGAFGTFTAEGSRPTIATTNGGFSNLVLASGSSVQGLDLSGGFYGIFASGIANASVTDVDISGVNPGFAAFGSGVFVVNSTNVDLTDVEVGFLSGNNASGITYDFSTGDMSNVRVLGVGSDFFGSLNTAGILVDDSIVTIADSSIADIFGSGFVGFQPSNLRIQGSNVTLNNTVLSSSVDPSGLFGLTRGIVVQDTAFTNLLSGTGNTTSGNLGIACQTAGATITGVIGLDGGTCP